MTAIIFGGNGQDGYYLSFLLKNIGIDCVSVSRSSGIKCDVSNYDDVDLIIKKYLPSFVFNFAANSTTNHNALFENYNAISTGSLNILNSVYNNCKDCKVFITGSAVQFENTGKPIDENSEFEPNSAYSVARIQSIYMARYFRSLGVPVYVGYLFHHESLLRKNGHISKIVTNAINDIINGATDRKIKIGNISVIKEWTYAKDTMEAILILMQQDNIFEAVIGSGIGYSIKSWIEECFSLSGLNWEEHVITDASYVPEYLSLISSPNIIKSLGWSPKVDFKVLARKMVLGEI
jgi:GDPmannose 4,6-dehydratase